MILRGNFLSETMRMGTNLQILIPNETEGPFRVAYLLHGLHGDQGTWLDNTMLPVYSKKYKIIFIMPEAGRSFYLNLKYGRKYFDYMSEELPRISRGIFNISPKREDTAIIGCSMGGYGALRMVLTKPEQFGFCGAISPACLYFKHILDGLRKDPHPYLKTGPEAEETYNDMLSAYGDNLEYRKDTDIVELAKAFPASMPGPKIYVTCGTEDDLRKENLIFREDIKSLNFDYTYEEWTGSHDWFFFNEAMKKTLEFWFQSDKQ